MSAGAVLVYDGDCGMCNGWVRRVLRHDRRRMLRFAAVASRYTSELLERHPDLRGVDSTFWVEADDSGEIVRVRSDAVLRTAAYLGGFWRLAGLLRLIPRSLRDAAYDVLARNRHRISPRPAACPAPKPAIRERFLT